MKQDHSKTIMIQSLRDVQQSMGAIFEPDCPAPASFGNDVAAYQAARQSVVLSDRCHWGRIQVTGSDRQVFLHNQSTNDINRLKPGEGCDTVFVTSTARTLDLVTGYVLDDAVLVVVSPKQREKLLAWLDRYIFFGDQVRLTDVTDETALFSLIGPDSPYLLERLGIRSLTDHPYASHTLVTLAGQEVRIAVGSGLGLEGYSLIVPAAAAASVWQALIDAGALPLGDRGWEQIRVEQGRPLPDCELTEDYNPLEAGLWQAVSFNKGCYIGQETIARLDAYKGVKQQLWGLRLQGRPAPGTPITLESEKIGILTSLTETEQGPFGLAYIRTKAGGEGLTVQVGDTTGKVVSVPFLTHTKP